MPSAELLICPETTLRGLDSAYWEPGTEPPREYGHLVRGRGITRRLRNTRHFNFVLISRGGRLRGTENRAIGVALYASLMPPIPPLAT